MVKQFLFIGLIGLAPLCAHSQTSVGAISGGLAGAGRSSADIGESYILNPASVAHLRGAAISFGTNSLKPGTSANTPKYDGWHLSLNENSPDSMIASSIYVSQTYTDSINNPSFGATQLNDVWFTAGNFVMPQMSVGLSYHYHESQTNFAAYQEHNFNLGFLWTPLANLGVGVSFHNLRPTPPEIPVALSQGTTGGLGLLYLHEDFLRLRIDFSRKIHRLESSSYNEWAFGVENLMTPWLLTRIGISQQATENNMRTQKFAFGLGFAGPRFGIHYGYQQFQMAQRGTEHSVDFMIPF